MPLVLNDPARRGPTRSASARAPRVASARRCTSPPARSCRTGTTRTRSASRPPACRRPSTYALGSLSGRTGDHRGVIDDRAVELVRDYLTDHAREQTPASTLEQIAGTDR